MNDISFTWILDLVLFLIALIGIGIYITLLILHGIKKKNIKLITISFVCYILVLFAIFGAVKINDYSKDKWVYELRSEIIDKYPVVTRIDYSFDLNNLSLFVYLKDEQLDSCEIQKVASDVFDYFAEYFLTKNGIEKSKSSWTKRGRVGYEEICIYLYESTDGSKIVEYSSAYYTDGMCEEVNEYKIWRKYYDGKFEEFTPQNRVGSEITNSNNTNPNEKEKIISFKGYYLDRNIYYDFIENPQKKLLDEDAEDIYIITKSPTKEGVIIEEKISSDPVEVNEYDTEDYSLYYELFLYDSFIEFVGDITEMEKYLKQNGITEDIENIAYIYSGTFHGDVIWVKTNQNNYFITINERYGEYYDYIEEFFSTDNYNSEIYFYRLYDHSEYYEKYRMKDGKLIVKGKDATEDNYVKITCEYAEISLNAVIKQFGGEAEWNDDKQEGIITYENKKYIFDKKNLSMIEAGNKSDHPDDMILPDCLAGGYQHCEIINGEIILDSNSSMFWITKNLLGVEIDIDSNKLIVYIN